MAARSSKRPEEEVAALEATAHPCAGAQASSTKIEAGLCMPRTMRCTYVHRPVSTRGFGPDKPIESW